MSYDATLTGAGWIVSPILNPVNNLPSSPLAATLDANGWTVQPIVAPSARGPELIVPGAWALTGGVSIVNGKFVFSNAAVGDGIKQLVLTIGKIYEATYTIESLSAGNFRIYAGNSGPGTIRNAPGTYREKIVCVGTTEANLQARTLGTTAVVSGVSFREVL